MKRRGFLKRCAGLLGLSAVVPVATTDKKSEFYRSMWEGGRISVSDVRRMDALDAQHLQTKRGRLESRTRLVPCRTALGTVMVDQSYIVVVFDDGSVVPLSDDEFNRLIGGTFHAVRPESFVA